MSAQFANEDADAELHGQIQREISGLHEFFRRLHEKDQKEIRWVRGAAACLATIYI